MAGFNLETHRVRGSGGSNQLRGKYELTGDRLKFSRMTATMMACGQGMKTEKSFLKVLETVSMWKVEDQQLERFDSGR